MLYVKSAFFNSMQRQRVQGDYFQRVQHKMTSTCPKVTYFARQRVQRDYFQRVQRVQRDYFQHKMTSTCPKVAYFARQRVQRDYFQLEMALT